MGFLDTLLGIMFHGMAYAMMLYLIFVGLSVTMGLLGIANLAHGVFAMAEGYLAMTLLSSRGWSFPAAIGVCFLVIALLGVFLERTLYSRLYKSTELEQVLFSIGAIFVGAAIFHYLYGPLVQRVDLPTTLRGAITVGSFSFPVYRLMLIVVGLLVFACSASSPLRPNEGLHERRISGSS